MSEYRCRIHLWVGLWFAREESVRPANAHCDYQLYAVRPCNDVSEYGSTMIWPERIIRICTHCTLPRKEHAEDGHCLFSPTSWELEGPP